MFQNVSDTWIKIQTSERDFWRLKWRLKFESETSLFKLPNLARIKIFPACALYFAPSFLSPCLQNALLFLVVSLVSRIPLFKKHIKIPVFVLRWLTAVGLSCSVLETYLCFPVTFASQYRRAWHLCTLTVLSGNHYQSSYSNFQEKKSKKSMAWWNKSTFWGKKSTFLSKKCTKKHFETL